LKGTTVENEKEVTKTYKIVNGSMTFTLTGGVITETSDNTKDTTKEQTDSYYYYKDTESNTTIKVCDALTDITISKKDIDRISAGELSNAEMELTVEEGQTIDLSNVIVENGTNVSKETGKNHMGKQVVRQPF